MNITVCCTVQEGWCGGRCLAEGGEGSTCEKSTDGTDVSVSGCCTVELPHNNIWPKATLIKILSLE